METYKCRLCEHTWQSRDPNAIKPLSCPRCKRYDWEKKLKIVEKITHPKEEELHIVDEKKEAAADLKKKYLEE